MRYKMSIGLETHIKLKTRSKIFSSAQNSGNGLPNTNIDYVDLGLPGSLPVLNKEVIDMAIVFGLSISGDIASKTVFSRKNYFYPDLPKGYQISQLDQPIIKNGFLEIVTNNKNKKIRIDRAHLEEDAGKSVHSIMGNNTGINYNRSGTPLLEVVTYPDFNSSKEVEIYLKKLYELVCHLDLCDGNMQEGSFRCDVNISISNRDNTLGTRTEIKNINSFNFINLAIESEFNRQINLIKSGKRIYQETRLYDPDKNKTISMRKKEYSFDYRYFPDPDLLPIYIDRDSVEKLKNRLVKHPDLRRKKYILELGSEEDVNFLMENTDIANYYDFLSKSIECRRAFNWIKGELQGFFRKIKRGFSEKIVPHHISSEILMNIKKNLISIKSAKIILHKYSKLNYTVDEIISKFSLKQDNNSCLIEETAENIIKKYPFQFQEYKKGKDKLIGFFVGKIIRSCNTTVNPKLVHEIFLSKTRE